MTASGWWRDLTSRELAGLDPEVTVALLPVADLVCDMAATPLALLADRAPAAGNRQ
jgi:hypothetical protein